MPTLTVADCAWTDLGGLSGPLQERLGQILDAQHHEYGRESHLIDVGKYALSAPGKMVRGRMVLQACKAVGGDPETALWAAAGSESGHLASLIHDDLMDRDEMRRGQPSIWNKFDADDAILAGDLFIFEAFYCLALCRGAVHSDRIVRALEVVSKSCIDLCLGQALEARLTGNCDATTELYWAVVRGKTASLFRSACESGAILGGGSERRVIALRSFGECLGLAYQVIDDLLPYLGQEKALGKSATSDVRNRRVTLPVLYGLAIGSVEDVATLRSIFTAPTSAAAAAGEHRTVMQILQRSDALATAARDAARLLQQSLEHLRVLPASTGRDALATIASLVNERIP
jgi:geranylgeranyl pyrophosphate synthase